MELIGENQREYGLRKGDHDNQGCSRKDTSILSRTFNLFDFSRSAYRNSTWRSLNLKLFVIRKNPYIYGMFR